MLLTNVPIDRLFRLRFRTMKDGGFAGLAFFVGRAADDPEAHMRFVQDWSSTHDLTDRYLGVIAPMPGWKILVAGPFVGGEGHVVPDVGLLGHRYLGDHHQMRAKSWTRSVQMLSDPPADGLDQHEYLVTAGSRVGSEADHGDSLTRVATAFQNFFGIPESLLPCAVIVSMQGKEAFAVPLGGSLTMYQLLKHIKIQIEPTAAQINEKEAEIRAVSSAVSEDDYRYLKMEPAMHRADAIYREWDEHRAQVATLLAEAATHRTGEDRELCSWMSERLALRDPLTAEENARAQRLLVLMRAGRFGVPRRLQRVLTKLSNGYPGEHPDVLAVTGFDAAAFPAVLEREKARQRAVSMLMAEKHRICDQIDLSAAVHAAAAELGLEQSDPERILRWRSFDWPITVLVRPPGSRPGVRFGLA